MPVQTLRKGKSPYYTEEQYHYAREECNALEYAQSRGYNLVRKGNYYQMKEHDSMVFTTDGRWFWNSHSLKGRAIEFVMAYEDKTLPEAVLILNHAEDQTYEDAKAGIRPQRSIPHPARANPFSTPPAEKAPFKLPAQSPDFRRMFGYLCGTRKLDQEILKYIISQDSLYESVFRYMDKSTGELKEIHNAVFVGKDAYGKPRSAFQRGLSSLGSNTTYKRDVPGSDASASFCIPGHASVETVLVFEASIDAISHACIYKDAGLDYKMYDRIALGGTEKTVGLTTYLQSHPNITRVVIAMDEDAAGRAADQKIRELLSGERSYSVVSLRQCVGKDWNDYLVKWRQVAEDSGQLPTTSNYAMERGETVGRIHYLDDRGTVMSTVAYDDWAAFQHQVRRSLNHGQRIVAETPAQQERIHHDREPCTPAQAPPDPDCEMEL